MFCALIPLKKNEAILLKNIDLISFQNCHILIFMCMYLYINIYVVYVLIDVYIYNTE